MIEKPVFLSNRGKVVIAIVVIVVIGAGIYWFNQSPLLQEKVNGFNPLEPLGNENLQENPAGNPGSEPVKANPSGGNADSQTGPGGDGDGTTQETTGQDNGNGGGSGGSNGGSGGDEGEGEVIIQGNCEESEGRICSEGQTCDGSVLSTLDTDQCCFGKCV